MSDKKRALIIHGTDGAPDDHWQPWLKKQLEVSGYEVVAPQFPDNHYPNAQLWGQYLRDNYQDLNYDILVGHSSGSTMILHLLEADWFPKVRAAVLVGVFLNDDMVKSIGWYNPEQFANILPQKPFDLMKIKDKANKFYFLHGDNDPYCSYSDAKQLSGKLGGEFITVSGGHHLSVESELTELPFIMTVLRRDGLIG
ncbi:MAG: RBBP9/YdeN family alpha/beta hydrolase [Candidatus Nanosyncoccaceae bacterium]|jgi:predicted alpha/beta hydrolase family esterase